MTGRVRNSGHSDSPTSVSGTCARAFGIACAVLALTGCASGPDYHQPTAAALGVPAQYSVAASASGREQLGRWWSRFDDPLLSRLIVQGSEANLDVAVALSRLRQAREGLVQARAANLPLIGASGNYSHSHALSGPNAGTSQDAVSLAIDASWQADLFGGRRRSIEAARADADASRYDLGAVLVSVQAEIATNYLLARLQQAQLDSARQSLVNQDDNLQIAGWRNRAGLVSALDLEQARSQRAQTAATISQLQSGFDQAIARLGVLLGGAPGMLRNEFIATAPIPQGVAVVAVGVPAEALRQRPDVRSSERQLAAATARIGVAEAQLYPALTLSGNIVTDAVAFGGLFETITGKAFASLAQTIFDGGRLHSQVRSQQAAAQGALASYHKTVLTALADVENAVVAMRSADRRQAEFRAALDAANNSAILARLQYRSGLIDFTALLVTENALLASRNGLAQAQYDRAAALVQLYTALGGSWDESAPAPGISGDTSGLDK